MTGNSTPPGSHRTLKRPTFRERLVRGPAFLSYPILALDHFFADHGTVRAAALTYTTLLALVPMLAFGFASLRGLGFADELFQIIFNQLGPVFDPEIRDRLFSYVTRVNVRTLGTIGLAAFLFSAILTLNTIEKALNFIFEVKRSRPLVRKFTRLLQHSVSHSAPLGYYTQRDNRFPNPGLACTLGGSLDPYDGSGGLT